MPGETGMSSAVIYELMSKLCTASKPNFSVKVMPKVPYPTTKGIQMVTKSAPAMPKPKIFLPQL